MLIRSGSYGVIYLEENKFIRKRVKVPSGIRAINNEINILLKLKGVDGVIQIIDYQKSKLVPNFRVPFIKGGDLRDFMTRHHFITSCDDFDRYYEDVLHITKQLVSVVEAIHLRNIAHLDLKPDNILIDEDKTIYLADFGTATENGSSPSEDHLVGSFQYVAPEILAYELFIPIQADLWSLSVVVFQLLYHSLPFETALENDLSYKAFLKDGTLWKKFMEAPQPFKDIIESGLQVNYQKRKLINSKLIV